MSTLKDEIEDYSKYPASELEKKLKGVRYPHYVICSGDRRKPLGTPGCCCLNYLKREMNRPV